MEIDLCLMEFLLSLKRNVTLVENANQSLHLTFNEANQKLRQNSHTLLVKLQMSHWETTHVLHHILSLPFFSQIYL